MSILVIGLALLISHFAGSLWRPALQRLLNAYLDRFNAYLKRFKLLDGGIGVLIILLPALVLVASGQYLLQSDGQVLWAFVYSVFFVTMALGPRSLEGDVQAYLQGEDEAARSEAAEVLSFTYRDPISSGSLDGVIRGVFYQALVRWFGVIFWFLILGATGAILFRLVHQLIGWRRDPAMLTERQRITCKTLVGVLDLLPAALTTFALAIVGDFDTVIRTWRRHFETVQRSRFSWDCEYLPEVGLRTVMRGDEFEDAFSHDYDGGSAKVSLAMSLIYRALVCWLTIIALMIIANWVQ